MVTMMMPGGGHETRVYQVAWAESNWVRGWLRFWTVFFILCGLGAKIGFDCIFSCGAGPPLAAGDCPLMAVVADGGGAGWLRAGGSGDGKGNIDARFVRTRIILRARGAFRLVIHFVCVRNSVAPTPNCCDTSWGNLNWPTISSKCVGRKRVEVGAQWTQRQFRKSARCCRPLRKYGKTGRKTI